MGTICGQPLMCVLSLLGRWKVLSATNGAAERPGVRDGVPPLVQAPPGRVHPLRPDDRAQLPHLAQGQGHGAHALRRRAGRR